jgi:hypothetical protein
MTILEIGISFPTTKIQDLRSCWRKVFCDSQHLSWNRYDTIDKNQRKELRVGFTHGNSSSFSVPAFVVILSRKVEGTELIRQKGGMTRKWQNGYQLKHLTCCIQALFSWNELESCSGYSSKTLLHLNVSVHASLTKKCPSNNKGSNPSCSTYNMASAFARAAG